MSEHWIVKVLLSIQSDEYPYPELLLSEHVPVKVDPVVATIVSPSPALSQADSSAEVATVEELGAMHADAEVDPEFWLYFPGLQLVQLEEPATSLYDPASHDQQ